MNTVQLEDFCRILGFDQKVCFHLEPHWQLLLEKQREQPEYLTAAFFERYYPYCNGPDIDLVRPQLEQVLHKCGKLPELTLLLHILQRGMYELNPALNFNFLPDTIEPLGELSGILFLLAVLSGITYIEQSYNEAGVPLSYAYEALKWIGGNMQVYSIAIKGRFGMKANGWMRHLVDKKLFRIGRLEYLLHPSPAWLSAIYRRQDGKIAVLCQDGWRFDKQGKRLADDEKADFVSRLQEDSLSISGTPVSPDGLPDFNRKVTLQRQLWSPLLSPWDLCPSIHIPGGEKMPFDEVKRSMLEAREFFSKYFQRHVPLFCCCSWILNPAWEHYLPNSNMARFRRECYAIPAVSWGDKAGMFFLFGRSDVSPLELEASNSAQKAMQEAYKNKELASGAVFVPSQDIEKLENEYYRREYAAPVK